MSVRGSAPGSDHAPPSKLLWAAELPRAAWAVVSLLGARKMLDAAPKGDGRPVLLLPGLVNSDRSNFVMRRYLERLGYRAEGWGLGRNIGRRAVGNDGEKLLDRIRALHAETGVPVTLIGVSLGGIMARFAAHRLPDLVREVITVSSPFAGSPRATNVWRAFELLSGDKVDSERVTQQAAEVVRPLPVPSTAIWSRSDGLVNGMICHVDDDPQCCNVEIRASHMGVQLRPEVLRLIADILGGATGRG
ncbi:alpha/beta hydrolase [Sphingomonas sp. So64.6b]|uniref:esterase/lipase family protein n=1 Tax=Sphingomonas sp. So64.6b TaxID=2997354 RepID=UPI001601E590|nr:alpha/beta hydrolase [Sphingomonas sp. So64.6b]QNA83016.1 alpha/beta hydrolase [Sphingomonas sp. So64.6b]